MGRELPRAIRVATQDQEHRLWTSELRVRGKTFHLGLVRWAGKRWAPRVKVPFTKVVVMLPAPPLEKERLQPGDSTMKPRSSSVGVGRGAGYVEHARQVQRFRVSPDQNSSSLAEASPPTELKNLGQSLSWQKESESAVGCPDLQIVYVTHGIPGAREILRRPSPVQ